MDLKTSIASLVAIGSIVAGVWVVDERYAHAADVRGLTTEVTRQIEMTRLGADTNTLELRRASLLDKIYDAAARQGPRTAGDKAIAERYQIELRDVDVTLRDKRRELERLKTSK